MNNEECLNETCIFCGRDLASFPNMKFVQSGVPGMGICFSCNEKIYDTVKDYKTAEDKVRSKNGLKEFLKNMKVYKPKEFKAKLDEFVIGQDSAKIALSVAVYNHYKKVVNNVCDDKDFLDKSNVLMLGPSGSGKCVCEDTSVNLRNKKTGKKIQLSISEFKKIAGLADHS